MSICLVTLASAGDIAGDGGAGDGDARGGVLRLLHRTPAIGRQRGVAPIVLLGESRLGLIDGDGRACAVDQRVLGVQRRPPVGDPGRGSGDAGLRLRQRDVEVAVVDARQHLAGFDRLIVVDQHRAQVAGDLGGDGRVVRLHIGVVGGNLEAAHRPILSGELSARRQREHARAG